ncbi:glycosyltransferase family 2 protein [Epilithonimonas sp. UC225_85]|uniref:glycosyltransferase family 2 protein n=1 Tax=Epilithonimonas sp. UC225_85 TaxID=3350167 RepID=UPI0036D2AE75
MENAKVTVYIPTKNRLVLVKKAIDSVMQQTYNNWELIVVNDASTDETKDYLDKLSTENPKIKAIHHQESLGACVSRNDAIFSATGEFITGLDDDDYFAPNRLANFIKEWDDNLIGLCTDNISVIDNVEAEKNIQPETYIKQKDLLYFNFINNQIFTKTKSLRDIGGFEPSLKVWQDYECWYRLLSKGKAKKLSEPTYYFDVSDRVDRISLARKEKALDSYNIFIKNNRLSKTESEILKIPLLYYGFGKINLWFIFKMLFLTGFDHNYFNFLNKEVIKPILKKATKK